MLKIVKFVVAYRNTTSVKTLVPPTNAQLCNVCILSSTRLVHVLAQSPSSGSLHQNFFKTCSISGCTITRLKVFIAPKHVAAK